MRFVRALAAYCLFGIAASALTGCDSTNPESRYTPQVAVSERALDAALDAWQKQSSQPLALEDKTSVLVIDQYRRPGQTLTAYKILGEVSGAHGRWFEVKLELDHPAQVEQVRYVVVGIKPLWVFRQPDYEMLSHWDHPMPEATPPKAPSDN